MKRPIRYSIVVPVYRNRDSLPAVLERLAAMNEARQGALEAVFVIDGSPDDSAEYLRSSLPAALLTAQLVVLSRNFGSFSAIRTGLNVAQGEFIGVMAADLQEPPEVVSAFFDALDAGTCDVAIGQRTSRSDPALASLFSRTYWATYRRLINRDIPAGGVDVFGCTRAVARQVSAFTEAETSLIGILYWVGYRRQYFPYERRPREHGSSGWTFSRKVRYLLDSVYAFTDLPIILLQAIGFLGFLISVLVGLIVFVAWLAGGIRQPGYTPLMIAVLGSASALLLGLGVVGSYVARTYENTKARPIALVASHERFEPGE